MANKQRPVVSQRTNLVTQRDRTHWMELYGYTTYARELAVIFGINAHTLHQRIKSNWPIEAACLADPTENWKITNIDEFMDQDWVVPMFEASLKRYFGKQK